VLNVPFLFYSKALNKIKTLEVIVMKIKNYLLDLDDKLYSKPGSDNIRVYGIGEIIKEIYSDLKKFKSIPEIENEIRSHQVFSNWILGKSGIAIQDLYSLCLSWKGICRKSEEEFELLWDKIYAETKYFGSTNGKQIKLPKRIDYKLAYLLGVILGDGHLADPNKSYDKLTTYNSELRITDQNKETFISLASIFKGLFGYNPRIYSEQSKVDRTFYRFVIRLKSLHRFLMVVCGMPFGDKRGKVKIPEIIKNAPPDLQKWFIAGFFDADGSIGLTKNRWPVIHISQYDSSILKEIIDISSKLGVNWLGPYDYKYKYNNCTIKIYNKRDAERFLSNIPSLNPIKLKQREILCQKLKEYPTI